MWGRELSTVELYSKYVEREISSTLCAQMERHLEVCVHCTAACETLKQTLSLCRRFPAASVPAPVQATVRTALRGFLGSSA